MGELINLLFIIFLFFSNFTFSQTKEEMIKEIVPLLKSKGWSYQAFGVMRLERYKDLPETSAIINNILKSFKYDKKIKIFALRTAGRLGLKLPESTLLRLKDPLLLRAALFSGVNINLKYIKGLVSSNLRSKNASNVMVAIEIALVAPGIVEQKDVDKAIKKLLSGMDSEKSMLVGERLCRVLGEKLINNPSWEELSNNFKLISSKDFQGFIKKSTNNLFSSSNIESFNTFTNYYESLKERDFDLVVALDGTGSMEYVLRQTQYQIFRLINVFTDFSKSVNLGIVIYRDEIDGKAHLFDLTKNFNKAVGYLSKVKAEGGDDSWEEWVTSGVLKAESAKWRRSSERHLVIIGDAGPHAKNMPALRKKIGEMRKAQKITTHAISTTGYMISPFEELTKIANGKFGMLKDNMEIAEMILKFSMEPEAHELFGEFYSVYSLYCN